jgi:aryl-alcohol dehydrogenase-like predicted oxidoreductase/enamine deaminase RidA (YjgF/YER057c/UK114 family)
MTAAAPRLSLAPGFTISRIITGLWQVADLERDGRSLDHGAAVAGMEAYASAGCTTFDMADHYGSAEEIAGRFAAGRAGAVELLTKWVPRPGRLTRQDVRTAVERSLERLRVGAIDLLQFHAWNFADPGWLDALFWLEELKRSGMIRHLGVTNFDTVHLSVIAHSGIEVVSNQVCFSLIDRRPLAQMTALCTEHGIALLAYGALAGGFLSERWLGARAPAPDGLETWSQMKYRRFIDVAGGWDAFQGLLGAAHAVARRHGVSIATVALRYVLDQPAVAGVIVGARLGVREHIAENLGAFHLKLDAADREEIEWAAGALQPIPGDCGDEYRRPPFLTAAGDLSHHVQEFPPPYELRRGAGGRVHVMSGTPWEELAGYSRAVRSGNRIWVSGTTATHRDRLIGGTDAAAQTHFVIDKIEGALQSLGARLEDVVRTRIFVQRRSDWEAVARAHGERFAAIRPANTLVEAPLIGEQYLVEMEAEADVG